MLQFDDFSPKLLAQTPDCKCIWSFFFQGIFMDQERENEKNIHWVLLLNVTGGADAQANMANEEDTAGFLAVFYSRGGKPHLEQKPPLPT